MIDIEIDKQALKDIQEKFGVATIQNMLDKSIKKTIILLDRYAIEETPTDQGLLRNSFKTEFKKSYGRLFNNTEYAIFVHEGTRPHSAPFTPIAQWAERHGLNPGSVWFAIRMKGTKANPFMQRAVERADEEIDDIFQNEIDKMINEMTK